MKMTHLALVTVVTGLTLACVPTSRMEPRRDDGLSVFMFPKRVADLDATRKAKWGFVLNEPKDHSRPADRPAFQTAEDLLVYYRSLPGSVRQNGLWVLVTHPDAYSVEENAILYQLKSLCAKQEVPLFVSRASELPDGWKRVS